MKTPRGAEVADLFGAERWSDIYKNAESLRLKYGEKPLERAYIEAYPLVQGWRGRKFVLFELARYARSNPAVVDLALGALHDKSGKVRADACAVLAYALRREYLPQLREARRHRDAETVYSVEAAIDAIEHQNHHYFVDREHTNTTFWVLNDGDDDIAA